MSQELNNLAVKRGMALGFVVTLSLFVGLYFISPKFTQELMLADRLKLGLECLIFPALFFLVVVLRVGSQRFGNPAENPVEMMASSEGMKIDLRVLSNTHEQIVLFVINALSLAVLLPYEYLSLLPIYSALFVVGRILFWLGYRHKVLWRAPGFAMGVLPAVLGLGYSSIVIVVNVFSNT